MPSKTLTICNTLGLHARAAAKLTTTASRFTCTTEIIANNKKVDCKSVMSLMLLAAGKGTSVEVITEGDDASAALSAIETLINNRFDEEQ